MTTNASTPRSPNKILARLPATEYARLIPDLRSVSLYARQVLIAPHMSPRHIHFLESGVCGIGIETADGEVAGVVTIGSEGFVGASALGSHSESSETAIMEVDGNSQVMEIDTFRHAMERRGIFADLINGYTYALPHSLTQTVVCNALHSVEQRCARCLLEFRDRLDSDDLPLTHDTLARLLGVRRASVSVAARALNRAGVIQHGYKHIVVRDGRRLENMACECYGVMKRHLARQFE